MAGKLLDFSSHAMSSVALATWSRDVRLNHAAWLKHLEERFDSRLGTREYVVTFFSGLLDRDAYERAT